MVFSCFTRSTHRQAPSKLIVRSTSLAVVVVFSLCSIFYLTRSFPGYSVKTKLEHLLPSVSVKTQLKLHWNDSPRRLIVFGDSWSDNGQYPINPPPHGQVATRDEAQGKIWTDWLCSSVGLSQCSCWLNTDTPLRFRVPITTILQDLYHMDGTLVTVAQWLTVIY